MRSRRESSLLLRPFLAKAMIGDVLCNAGRSSVRPPFPCLEHARYATKQQCCTEPQPHLLFRDCYGSLILEDGGRISEVNIIFSQVLARLALIPPQTLQLGAYAQS
jgi:hypothetical protein